MKKRIIATVFSGALLAFCSISFSSSGQASVEPPPGTNTGPAKIVDCRWWFTGDKKICMSENQYSCTETECF